MLLISKLFGLPGRAAIDGMASIAAAAGVGVLITLDQYRKGFYRLREATQPIAEVWCKLLATRSILTSIAADGVTLPLR